MHTAPDEFRVRGSQMCFNAQPRKPRQPEMSSGSGILRSVITQNPEKPDSPRWIPGQGILDMFLTNNPENPDSPRWLPGQGILDVFLDASTHLYKRVCPSVHRSVRWSVRGSVMRFFRSRKNDWKWSESIRNLIKTTFKHFYNLSFPIFLSQSLFSIFKIFTKFGTHRCTLGYLFTNNPENPDSPRWIPGRAISDVFLTQKPETPDSPRWIRDWGILDVFLN